MVYEAKTIKDSKSVVQWDSSLSPSSDQTCLEVQVVAVFPEDQSTTTNLAMVVVGKRPQTGKSLPPFLRNLFEDSEKQILKALDRGLEKYMSGKISFGATKSNSYLEGRESILAEILGNDDDQLQQESTPKPGFTDAEIVSKRQSTSELSREEANAQRTFEVKKSTASSSSSTNNRANPPGLDFAVQQAKLAAERNAKRTTSGNFAVDAAKRAAEKMRKKNVRSTSLPGNTKVTRIPEEEDNQSERLDGDKASPIRMDMLSCRPASLDRSATGKPRAFMQTISRPADYLKDQATSSVIPNPPIARNINLNIRQDAGGDAVLSDRDLVNDPSDITDPKQREMIKAAQDALLEMSEQGEELTPEELLNQVMKFGEVQDNESTVGAGFVSGAFEKAKDLLREQRQRREDRLMYDVADKAAAEVRTRTAETINIKTMTIEEELRRMFEAGENIADGRLSKIETSGAYSEEEMMENKNEVDNLIALENSISSHARILDDELAELEVRINKSPDEELDGPAKAPLFDIFSGPEVYNPNVDPETAVNWPGASPGTGTIRLPKELDEALRQAQFASEVLQKMKEVKEESLDGNSVTTYFVGNRQLTDKQVQNMRTLMVEAVDIGLIDNPLIKMKESSQLQMLIDELWDQPEERHTEITSNYKDLLLSDNFVTLVKERLTMMADRDLEAMRRGDDATEKTSSRERQLLGGLVVAAQLLLKEARALGAQLETQQLEVIRSICKIAMDPKHDTEEETAQALTDGVREMRPLFDDSFVAYLKYAVAEEEAKLARAGLLDDPEHNQWLFVLKIVQQGVYAELARGINRYIDHIGYVLRMETAVERRLLLKQLIDVMPSLDVRPFVQVVDNIVGSLGDSVRGNFAGANVLGDMTNKLLQLSRDMKDLLPEERIALMSRDADEWAQRQREKLMESRSQTQKLLEAARETEHLDEEVESLARRGEVDRFD
ncbi:hypothetical protein FisN_4Hh407 [Fistulifera solaris]|uniref:Uncharacterized protein n=1 Tax=Fistulifera solaris TaxID=1519565 RepID=A0A1Z5KQ16_FISSO|nr:hypothetical protein FisN_4Hh407 [Fistulifera solaris]|eukprot:GAX28403.1 hypothetical protein FisN_4Hh407 [Fistulifera solaris]